MASWHPEEAYLLLTAERAEASARNQGYARGPGDARVTAEAEDAPPLWMRIDWVVLDASADDPAGGADEEGPWGWAYCMAVWDAESAAEARAAPPSRRASPRNGCGDSHPFTRMAQAGR